MLEHFYFDCVFEESIDVASPFVMITITFYYIPLWSTTTGFYWSFPITLTLYAFNEWDSFWSCVYVCFYILCICFFFSFRFDKFDQSNSFWNSASLSFWKSINDVIDGFWICGNMVWFKLKLFWCVKRGRHKVCSNFKHKNSIRIWWALVCIEKAGKCRNFVVRPRKNQRLRRFQVINSF